MAPSVVIAAHVVLMIGISTRIIIFLSVLVFSETLLQYKQESDCNQGRWGVRWCPNDAGRWNREPNTGQQSRRNSMDEPSNTNRRTVLKGIGAGVVGSAALVGATSAGDTGDNRRQESFTWADDDLFELLDSEPPAVNEHEEGQIDDEGAHQSHRDFWVIDTMKGTGVPGSEHSPHPNPAGLPIDHVVPIGGHGEFTAQWHVTLVLDSETGELTNQDDDGNFLLSADAIRTADVDGDIVTIPLFDPETGEPAVFTCPVRPHRHK